MTITETAASHPSRAEAAFASLARWRTPATAGLALEDLTWWEYRDAIVFAPRSGGADRFIVRESRVVHYGVDEADAEESEAAVAYRLLTATAHAHGRPRVVGRPPR